MKISIVSIFLFFIISCGGDGVKTSTTDPQITDENTDDDPDTGGPSNGSGDANPKNYHVVFKDPGVASVGDDLIIDLEIFDSKDVLAEGFEGEIQLVTGGSATRTGKITITSGKASVTIQDEVAEKLTLTLAGSSSEFLDISAVLDVNFIHDPAKFILITEVPETKAGVIADVEISVEDQYGNIATSFSGETTIVAGGSATILSVVSITEGQGIGRAQNSVAETVELSLSDSGATSLDVTSKISWIIVPNSAAKFALLPIPDIKVDLPLEITVEVHDSLGNIVKDYSNDVDLGASGSVVGLGLIDIVDGVGKITVTNAIVQTVVFLLNDTEQTGLDVSDFQQINFLML